MSYSFFLFGFMKRRLIFATCIAAGLLVTISFLQSVHSSYPLAGLKSAVTFETALRDIEQGIAETEQLLQSGPGSRLNLAAAWAPLAINECLKHLPSHAAPCLAREMDSKDVISATELIYEDFAIRHPIFLKDEYQQRWLAIAAHIPERAVIIDDWMVYRGQHGQNYVLSNRTFRNDPPTDVWSGEACMADSVHINGLKAMEMSGDPLLPAAPYFDQVILAGAPDSWSWQHFENRVTHILLQASSHSPVPEEAPYAVTGRKGSQIVDQLWQTMGFDADHVLHKPASVSARQMIFSCRAPLIHPWFAYATLERIGLAERWAFPDPVRKNKILYMSRSNGDARNVGRRIINEQEIIDAINGLLEERGHTEEIVMFSHNNFKNVTELMSFMVEEVAVIISPHGGSLMNHRFASRNTFIIEFMVETWPGMSNYEETGLLRQPYAALVMPPAPGTKTDMHVNATDVVDLLRHHFGATEERKTLRHHYQWTAPEMHIDEEMNLPQQGFRRA